MILVRSFKRGGFSGRFHCSYYAPCTITVYIYVCVDINDDSSNQSLYNKMKCNDLVASNNLFISPAIPTSTSVRATPLLSTNPLLYAKLAAWKPIVKEMNRNCLETTSF